MKKVLIRILSVVIIILALIGISFMTSGEIMGDVTQSTTVEVKDGVASPATMEGSSFTLEEDGEYAVDVKIENDSEGLITGFVVYDEAGDVVFFSTGEDLVVESTDLKLKAGDYKTEFRFITNEEELSQLVKEGKGEYYSEEEYAFTENGTFNVTMEYKVKEAGAMNIYYLLGVICGVAVGLAFVAILVYLTRKMGGKIDLDVKKDAYDERQLLARGVAYKFAFYTLLDGMVVIALMEEIAGIRLFMSMAGVWVMICISIAVFATICILKDAYMSLYENVKGVVIMFSAIGILNIAIGIGNIVDGVPLIENGVLSTRCANLIVGLLFVYILPVFIGRVIYNNKQLEEDEE